MLLDLLAVAILLSIWILSGAFFFCSSEDISFKDALIAWSLFSFLALSSFMIIPAGIWAIIRLLS